MGKRDEEMGLEWRWLVNGIIWVHRYTTNNVRKLQEELTRTARVAEQQTRGPKVPWALAHQCKIPFVLPSAEALQCLELLWWSPSVTTNHTRNTGRVAPFQHHTRLALQPPVSTVPILPQWTERTPQYCFTTGTSSHVTWLHKYHPIYTSLENTL